MRPIRTRDSNVVFQLPGGNEDNDLWAQRDGSGWVRTIWEPSDAERAAIAAGQNIALSVFRDPTPPVSIELALFDEVSRG